MNESASSEVCQLISFNLISLLTSLKRSCILQQFTYLGHVITKEGIRADPKKVAAILKMPTPRTLKQLRSPIITAYYHLVRPFTLLILYFNKLCTIIFSRYFLQ